MREVRGLAGKLADEVVVKYSEDSFDISAECRALGGLSTATGIGYAKFLVAESGRFEVVAKWLPAALSTNFWKSRLCRKESGRKEFRRGF